MASEPGIGFLETFDTICNKLNVGIDSNEMFMTEGIMNPKELYLTEEDSAHVKDAASSSDSGVSTFDDFQDIANVTDFNSLIDGELKDLDFAIDISSLHKLDEVDICDSGVLVKQEPASPSPDSSPSLSADSGVEAPCFQQPISPELFNFTDEVTIKQECGTSLSFEDHLFQPPQSPPAHQQSNVFSHVHQHQQQQQHQHPSQQSYRVSTHQPLLTTTAAATAATPVSQQPLFSLIQNTQQQHYHHQHQQQHNAFRKSPNSSPSAGRQQHGYVVVPSSPVSADSKKKIILSTITSSSSSSGGKRPTVISACSAPPVPLQLSRAASAERDGGSLLSPVASPPASSSSSSSYQIDAILNSNIRIQPKPGHEAKVSTGNIQWVTTSENGVSPQAISVTTQHGIPIITNPTSISTITDEKSFKRAQRIIKNRESACLSRKRKKEYMSSLEERLQQCANDNERLLRENEVLRRQVDVLRRENIELKQPQGTSPAKKICLMCVALLLTLNLSSLSLFGDPSNVSPPASMGITHSATGRSLLTLTDEMLASDLSLGYGAANDSRLSAEAQWSRFLDGSSPLRFDHELGLLAQRMNMTQRLGHMCPMYFNSTESVRLAEKLRGWMIHQEEEKKKSKKAGSLQNKRLKDEQRKKRKKKAYPPLRRFGVYGDDTLSQSHVVHTTRGVGERRSGTVARYPVQLFGAGFEPREQLLDAIPRRNDTFYVLSFSTDYYLVPATAHNKTMRPRMSLLMPVISSSLNGSQPHGTDQVDMMQIDCEILNTNLIHVRRSAFPESDAAAPAPNSTSFQFDQQQRDDQHRENRQNSSNTGDTGSSSSNSNSGTSSSQRQSHHSGNNTHSKEKHRFRDPLLNLTKN